MKTKRELLAEHDAHDENIKLLYASKMRGIDAIKRRKRTIKNLQSQMKELRKAIVDAKS